MLRNAPFFMNGLTIAKQSAIIIVLVSEFGRVPNTVIRVFTVSFTYWVNGTFFVSEPIPYWAQASSLLGGCWLLLYITAVNPSEKERSMIMLKQCQDSYHSTFGTYEDMLDYHEEQVKASQWQRCQVNTLQVEPLDKASPLYGSLSDFAAGVTQEAVDDTAENLGLAIRVNGELYPVRETAYKSLLDRAKIGGTALPKLGRDVLANVLNACLQLYSAEALLLIRDEKISAVHSGDSVDYSILPINELLTTLKAKLDDRFPGSVFEAGYCDHSLVSASWRMPNQREELLGTYIKTLCATGKGALASRLTPDIRFMTSDTGVASAKVSALLVGGQHPIHIGKCVAVDHRHQSKISDFTDVLDQLFAQFGDMVAKLEALLDITLDYPVNAMTRVCKKLSLPKKAAVEAISMFEMAYGGGPATAHDVFLALQEIPFILKTQSTPESKMLEVEENMARALTLKWSDYDLAKAVNY